MSEPFIGQIATTAFAFAPEQDTLCERKLVQIGQKQVLSSPHSIGFGGDGASTFGLPNLVERVACGTGTGADLPTRRLGDTFGEASVTLVTPRPPGHSHSPKIWEAGRGRAAQPPSSEAISATDVATLHGAPSDSPLRMHPMMLSPVGGGASHENRQPALNLCIAPIGDSPSFP